MALRAACAGEKEPTEKEPGEHVRLASGIGHLTGYLDSYDYDKLMDVLDELLKYSYDPVTDGLLENMKSAITRFAYEEALELMKAFRLQRPDSA